MIFAQLKNEILLLWTVLLIANVAISQPNSHINYTPRDGLPSSQVYQTIEDKYGYLWLLTDKGICRYDGYTFENFTTANGLSDNIFYKAVRTKGDKLWLLGNNSTLCRIVGKQPRFESYPHNDSLKKYLDHIIPNQFHINDSGDVIITTIGRYGYLQATISGEFSNKTYLPQGTNSFSHKIEKNGSHSFHYIADNPNTPGENAIVRPLYGSFNYDTWVYAHQTDSIEIHDASGRVIKVPNKDLIIGLGILDSTRFWVSYYNSGFRIFNKTGKELSHLFNGVSISNVYKDRENNLWISSLSEGVFQLKMSHIQSIPFNHDRNHIYQILKDDSGVLYISNYSGQAYRFMGDSLTKIFSNPDQSFIPLALINDTISGVIQRCLVNEYGKSSPVKMSTSYRIVPHSKDKVGFCCYHGYIEIDGIGNHSQNISITTYDAVYYQNILYLATVKGLFIYNNGVMSSEPLIEGRINDLHVENEQLHVGTHANGLYILSGNSRITHFRPEQLAGRFINAIHVSHNNTIWVCTNGGLSKLKLTRELKLASINHLRYEDGLPSKEVTSICIKNDTAYLGTVDGACMFPVTLIDNKKQSTHYYLRITDTEVNDKSTISSKLENLSYKENRIAFHFKGILLNGRDKLEYRYKLDGVEQTWNYTNDLVALYSNLSPGMYEFVLQTKSQNSNWEDHEIRQKFSIAPPYWQTAWFMATIIIIALGIIYLFFRFRVLLYNRDLVREMMRQVLKRLTKKTLYFTVREAGKDVRIASTEIKYVKSEGNYLEIHHEGGKTVIRQKIGDFLDLVPDPLEYLRVRRSYIVRIDHVEKKGKKEIVVSGETIQVGKTYLKDLDKIKF